MKISKKELSEFVKVCTPIQVKNPVVVILENIAVSNGHLIFTNLETAVRLKVGNGNENFCIPYAQVKKLLPKLDGEITLSGNETNSFLECNGNKFTFASENVLNNYPFPFMSKKEGKKFTLTSEHIEIMDGSVPFTANEDLLRPAMEGIAFRDGHIAATDGHRLTWNKTAYDIPETKDGIIFTKQGVKVLNSLKSSFEGYLLSREDGTCTTGKTAVLHSGKWSVQTRLIDDKFPDFLSVVPYKSDMASLMVNSKTFCDTVDMALLVANQVTHQVRLTLNGNVELNSQDMDLSTSYHKTIEGEHEGEIEIGFNGKMMNEILFNAKKGKEDVLFSFSAPNQGIIIDTNDRKMLIMPVMLNNY